MKIEMWSDIACPFCYIGKHHLQTAIAQLTNSGNIEPRYIELHYRAFLLDANAPKQPKETIYQQLSHKYGMSIDEAKASTQRIADQGKHIGLTFNFETLQPVNTIDAHRLIHFAERFGLASEMKEALFEAFFRDSLNIADHTVLLNLAKHVGLDSQAAETMLNSDDYLADIEADQQTIKARDIRSVPFFIFNDKYAISGAQPVSVFKELLEKLQREESVTNNTPNAGPGCTGDKCEL